MPEMSQSMDQECIYEIRVQGSLADRWTLWFEGLTIHREPNGETVLSGPLPDQAALHGVLARVRDLNLVLISVGRNRSAEQPPSHLGEES